MKRLLSMTLGLGLLLSTGSFLLADEHKADPHKTEKKDEHEKDKKDEHKTEKKDEHKKDHGNN